MMDLLTRGSGLKMRSMGKVYNNGLMVSSMKETTNMDAGRVPES